MDLLNADAVSFAYGERLAVGGVSLSLAPGEVVSLIGPNGSGKSTLIRVLLGALQASQGTVRWDGRDVREWRPRDLARRVAYLPQSPIAEPGDSVRDVLRLGRAPYWGPFGLESTRDAGVVREVAERLGLAEMLDRPAEQLSGGQRQRVFVGRCLVQEPAALLLDEPNTYLDLRAQVELLQLLRSLARERGVAVLMASHDLNLAAAFSDRLILLEAGRVAAAGKPPEVLEAGLLSRVYGLPMRQMGEWVVPTIG